MTDRMKGCVVSFERDIREDDVQKLVEAIMMIRGVSAVSLSVAKPDDYMNRHRLNDQMRNAVYDALDKVFHGATD